MKGGFVLLAVSGLLVVSLVYFALFGVRIKGPLQDIHSQSALRKFTKRHDSYVVAYFEDLSTPEATAYKDAVANISGLATGITSDDDVREKLGIDGAMGLVVKREGEKEFFTGKYSVEAIRKWIQAARAPLIMAFNESSHRHIFDGETKDFIFLVASKSSSEYSKLLEAFASAAKQLRGRTRYLFVDIDDEYNADYMGSFFGFEKTQAPAVCAASLGENGWEKFLADPTEVTVGNILAYNEAFLAGEVKRYYKSEKIPDDWNAKSVKVLVGKNFHEVIQRSGKSAFVLFHNPWSPYSKAIFPVWDELGDTFADSKEVLIAKVNAAHDMNQIDGLHFVGLPTIMIFPAGSTTGVEYKGARTLTDLVQFVTTNVEKRSNADEKNRSEL